MKKKEFINSRVNIFILIYLSVWFLFFLCSFLLWQNDTIEKLFNDFGLFVWIIIIPGIFSATMSLFQFNNTIKEIIVVEKLIESSDVAHRTIPLAKDFSKSMFIKHFRKIYTLGDKTFSQRVLNQYLEEMIFRGPSWLKLFTNSFPLLGIFGTTAGIATVFLSGKTGDEALIGFAYAISTTLLGVYLKYFFSLLNHIVITERNALLKAITFLFAKNTTEGY